jgi:hypothetical protein
MDSIKNGIFESKAKFIDVAQSRYALDAHYRRYQRGEKYSLAKQCFLHVEKLAGEGVDWAIKIKAGTF